MSQWLVVANGGAAAKPTTLAARRVDLSLEIFALEDGAAAPVAAQAAGMTITGSVSGRTRP